MTQPARRLGTSDTYVTPLALGAMIMGTSTPEDESRRILDHFVEEVTPRFAGPDGSRARGMIDTADCYCWWNVPGDVGGHSEELLGRWLADSGAGDRVHLATKGTGRLADFEGVWSADGGADWSVARTKFVGASAGVLRESLDGSLGRLGVDRVDLYYVHVDDPRAPLEETLATMADFVADGRVGAYGWSNVRSWRLGQIRALCEANGWPQPLALQQQHSYLRRRSGSDSVSIVDADQLSYLRAYPDLQLVAYSPILKGIYDSADKRARPGALVDYAGPDADARIATIARVARAVGCTPNQLVLAWMLAGDDPAVLPLVGPRTWDQYLQNMEALDVALTLEHVAELDAAGASTEPDVTRSALQAVD